MPIYLQLSVPQAGYKLVERNMSRKGDCWDNAVAESFFKTLKVEWVYQNKYRTRRQAGLWSSCHRHSYGSVIVFDFWDSLLVF